MEWYVVFGLKVASEFAFPELNSEGETTVSDSDVVLRRGQLDIPRSAAAGERFYCETPDEIYVSFDVGDFLIERGESVTVNPASEVDNRRLTQYILSSFGILLHQRGLLVLHGSVVCVDERAVVFLGSSGAGKSTTGAMFLLDGYPIVSDDIAAVQVEGEQPVVRPGVASVRLDPEIAADFGFLDETEQCVSASPKRRYRGREPPRDSIPLGRIYVLTDGEETHIEPLDPSERLVELVRNTYTMHLLRYTDSSTAHLHQCARVAETVPVRRLRRPRTLDATPRLVETIEQDSPNPTC